MSIKRTLSIIPVCAVLVMGGAGAASAHAQLVRATPAAGGTVQGFGVKFAAPSCADSAMEKHAACAAAISSSGFVPGAFSNRVVKEYGVFERTPLADETDPLPSLRPPFHTALAFRCIAIS